MITIPPWLAGIALGTLIAWLFDKEKEMIDCSKEITNFYNDKVALLETMKSEMRDKRNTNRDRLKSGLSQGDVTPIGMWSQGSYAMHTMIQAEDNDFDIDDGVYFKKEDLTDSFGSEVGPYDAKVMVRDALEHHALNTPPEIKDNCVRVKYEAGYHIDIPVYRTINKGEDNQYHELASASGWKESDPLAVTTWFQTAVSKKSPDSTNGQQMRRIVRLLKDFVKKNTAAHEEVPSGFLVSKLVEEEYEAHDGRDDEALYYTMQNIRDRLEDNLQVKHPVVDEMLTTGNYDPMTTLFKMQLDSALIKLETLFDTDSYAEALESWGLIFNEHSYFVAQASLRTQNDGFDELPINDNSNNGELSPSIWVKSDNDTLPVDKKGGGRNA